MRKSLYKKVMFAISTICLVLLVIIAIKLDAFVGFTTSAAYSILISVITNSYFSSILCSVMAVLIIYAVQVHYSKRMIKKDFRCNEIIHGIYDGIESFSKIKDEIPFRENRKLNEDFSEGHKKDDMVFYEFYKENIPKIEIITLYLSYSNNDILIESLQSCFFINLNFKLLNIINNIKNRLPNLRNGYPEIEEIYKKM